ncbi:MAG TPA: hypothetical protein DCY35_04605 [Prolixibacteraceae bacterium]|nr:hypothetical protein [Prolixibacteraceae bacterium]
MYSCLYHILGQSQVNVTAWYLLKKSYGDFLKNQKDKWAGPNIDKSFLQTNVCSDSFCDLWQT